MQVACQVFLAATAAARRRNSSHKTVWLVRHAFIFDSAREPSARSARTAPEGFEQLK
jgi:hypothetical protein